MSKSDLDKLDVVPVEGLVGHEEVVGGRESVPVGVQDLLVDAGRNQGCSGRFVIRLSMTTQCDPIIRMVSMNRITLRGPTVVFNKPASAVRSWARLSG